jgi:hypothetical protein
MWKLGLRHRIPTFVDNGTESFMKKKKLHKNHDKAFLVKFRDTGFLNSCIILLYLDLFNVVSPGMGGLLQSCLPQWLDSSGTWLLQGVWRPLL